MDFTDKTLSRSKRPSGVSWVTTALKPTDFPKGLNLKIAWTLLFVPAALKSTGDFGRFYRALKFFRGDNTFSQYDFHRRLGEADTDGHDAHCTKRL